MAETSPAGTAPVAGSTDQLPVDIETVLVGPGGEEPRGGGGDDEGPPGLAVRPYDADRTREKMAFWMLGILTFMVVAAFGTLWATMIGGTPSSSTPSAVVSAPAPGAPDTSAPQGGSGASSAVLRSMPSEPRPASQAAVAAAADTIAPRSHVGLQDLEKLLTIMFGPILTLIGTVLGFYFGGQRARETH